MLSKFTAWLDQINETYYNIGYIALVAIVGVLAIVFGFATAEILFGILLKSVSYTVSAVVFLKAAMGPKVDVRKEILEQGNIALAILIAGFFAGLGYSIGGM